MKSLPFVALLVGGHLFLAQRATEPTPSRRPRRTGDRHVMRSGGMIAIALVFLFVGAILLFGLVMVRPILKILAVPREIIMPIVFVLCVLGAWSISQRLFDVWVMLVVGVVCFLLRRRGFPVAPFVLGLVLGDIIDKSLRRGLVLSDGSFLPFVTRPISALLAVLVLVMLLARFPAVRRRFSRQA